MAAIEAPQSLKERKKALLIESELNRLVLQLELENIRGATSHAEGVVARLGNYATWLAPALSVAGMFAGTKLRKKILPPGLVKIALGALPLAYRFLRSKKSA